MANERTLVLNIIGDADSLHKSFQKAQVVSGGLGGALGGLGSKVGLVAGAIGVGLTAAVAGAIGYLSSASNATVDFGKQVIGLQRMTGGSAESVSGLSVVLKRVGIDSDGAGKLIKGLTKDMTNQKGELHALGIAVKDGTGHYRNYADIIGDFSDKFKNMTDPVERNAAAQKIFGKNWQTMLPILGMGSKGIAELTAKAKEYGLVLTEDNIKSIKEYTKAQKDADMASQGLQVQFGLIYLPVKTFIEQGLSKLIIGLTVLKPVAQTISDVVKSAMGPAFAYISTVISALIPIISDASAKITDAISFFTDGLKGIGDPGAITGTWMAAFYSLGESASTAFETIKTVIATAGEIIGAFSDGSAQKTQAFQAVLGTFKDYFATVFSTVSSILAKVVAFATPLIADMSKFITTQFGTVVAWVKTNWPLISATITVVMKAISDGIKTQMAVIKGIFDYVWPVISAVVTTACNAIKIVVSTAINAVLGIIKTVMQIITGDWEGAWESLKGVVSTVFSGIIKLVGTLMGGMVGVGKNIVQSLWKGIGSMASWLANKVRDFISSHVTQPIKKALHMSSPSKVMIDIGENVSKGMAIGMENSSPQVSFAAAGLANAAYNIPTFASSPSASGGNTTPITINVNGSIVTEKQLIDVVINGIRQANRLNGNVLAVS